MNKYIYITPHAIDRAKERISHRIEKMAWKNEGIRHFLQRMVKEAITKGKRQSSGDKFNYKRITFAVWGVTHEEPRLITVYPY
jgi:hypothetical protein